MIFVHAREFPLSRQIFVAYFTKEVNLSLAKLNWILMAV